MLWGVAAVPAATAAPVETKDAAATAAAAGKGVTFRDYLVAVERHSLDLRSQKENVTSARAGISIAGVRPDPQLVAGIDSMELNPGNRSNAATATMVGLSMTIETAGKRERRIDAAKQNVKTVEANLGAFLRELQRQSASAFVEACRTREALARKIASQQAFEKVVRANETRLKAGDIGLLELRQSRVESDRFAADVTSALAEAKAAETNLSAFLGVNFQEAFPGAAVECGFKKESAGFDLDVLIKDALKKRDDILVAEAAVAQAKTDASLVRANRWVDPTISVGLTHTPQVNPKYDTEGNVTNSPTLAPSESLGLTVSIPIPISRLQRGELIQAETAIRQAEIQKTSTVLKVVTEVRSTYTLYGAADRNVKSYAEHVLADAEEVLAGMEKSYRMGSASLLELLIARRTANEVYLSYLQAVSDLANAKVRLQLSAGMTPEL